MKRVILGGLMAAGCAVMASQTIRAAEAYDDTHAWYLSPMLQYTLLDHRRISEEHVGYQFGIGFNFAPNFAAEIAASNGSFKISGTGLSEKLTATSLDLLYKFPPMTSIFRPYVITGAGFMSDNIGHVSDNYNKWQAEAGAGLLTGVGSQTGRTRLQLRTEAKYRWEFSRAMIDVPRNPGDVIFGVGFQFMFGAPTPPPPPVARALPPPPPEPEPPPPPAPAPAPCVAPAGFQVDADCRIIEQTLVVRAVDFEFNSAQLTLPARQTLDEVGASLVKQPELNVQIQGYADSTGSADYNLRLSQKRAESVRSYLMAKGVNAAVLTAKGFGQANPIATNKTTEGRALNRRVAFQVTNTPPAHVKVVTEEATPASTEAAKQGEPERAKKEHQEH